MLKNLICRFMLNIKTEFRFNSYSPFTLCIFFLIATAILFIATNGLHRSQWMCSHIATVKTSPAPLQPIERRNKSYSMNRPLDQIKRTQGSGGSWIFSTKAVADQGFLNRGGPILKGGGTILFLPLFLGQTALGSATEVWYLRASS